LLKFNEIRKFACSKLLLNVGALRAKLLKIGFIVDGKVKLLNILQILQTQTFENL